MIKNKQIQYIHIYLSIYIYLYCTEFSRIDLYFETPLPKNNRFYVAGKNGIMGKY